MAHRALARAGLPRVAVGAATAAAVVVAAVLAAPAVHEAPLNVDEELTRRIAAGRFGAIFSTVTFDRGGGPLHFWLVHLTLQWPGGLPGLRAPSLALFLLALPAVALVALELAGAAAAAVTVLLTACAPLAVSYATFGRPHTLLLAWITWGTAAALRAARSGARSRWVAAGAILGSSIYGHPTAPVYALSAFAGAVAFAPGSARSVAARAWPGAAALIVTMAPQELLTAHVLADRYKVSAGAAQGRTFDGKPVWENAVRFLAPAPHGRLLNWLTLLAVAGVATLLVRRCYRSLAAVVLIVVLPVLFFTYVPANGLSALFFDRYVLPPLPLFLLLVAIGAVGVARLAQRAWPVVLVALAAGALTAELQTTLRHAHNLGKARLDQVTAVVHASSTNGVLFGSAGPQDRSGFLGALGFGRGPYVLDRYLALRIPSLPLVNDDTCVPVISYLHGPPVRRHGLFVFYASDPEEQQAALTAFARLPEVRVEVPAPRYFLLRTRAALPPRALVELALRVRTAWIAAVPENRRAGDLVTSDRLALSAPSRCAPRGPLGDPDISPNFPEVVT